MDARSYGVVFDTMADEYDRHRPGYPDELIDRACEAAGLSAGDPVLEIGCGTGQLTRSLVARGLHVTAVEPGENLIAIAGRTSSEVQFVQSRFENALLSAPFPAAFSASAFHWIDPDMGWRKAAKSLTPGGRLALIQYCGAQDESVDSDEDALMAVLTEAAPEIAAGWPRPRDVETIMAGVEERRENVSAVWAWIGGQDVARDYAASLFDEVQIAIAPSVVEQTADELDALFRTTSLYHRLAPAQREALASGNREVEQGLGRPIRSSMLAVLVTARRA